MASPPRLGPHPHPHGDRQPAGQRGDNRVTGPPRAGADRPNGAVRPGPARSGPAGTQPGGRPAGRETSRAGDQPGGRPADLRDGRDPRPDTRITRSSGLLPSTKTTLPPDGSGPFRDTRTGARTYLFRYLRLTARYLGQL